MIRSSSPAGAPSRRKFIPAAITAACPVLLIALVGGPSDAMAQATPAPPAAGATGAPAAPAGVTSFKPIEDKIKSMPTLSAADKSNLDTVIKDKIAGLADPNLMSRSRAWLVSETQLTVPVGGKTDASPAYQDAYANSVNTHVAPLIADPNPRVRLNGAIIVASTAQATGGIQLAPTALTLLNDKSEAVVLWGLKAARWIIPAQTRFVGKFNAQLANAIVPMVVAHSDGQVAGAFAVEAYDALTLDVLDPGRWPKVNAAQVTTIAPFVLQLIQARIPLYQKGVPAAPRADATGTRFLTDPKVWPNLNPAQQLAAVQAMSDLVALSAAQYATANPGDRVELAQVMQRAGAAIATLPGVQGGPIQQAVQINPAQATPAQIDAIAKAVQAALQAVPTFKSLKPAPPIKGNEAAPPPASAPTTGPVLIPGASAMPVAPPPAAAPVPPGTTPATGPAGATPKPAPKPPAGAAGAPGAAGGAQPPPTPAGGAAPKPGAGAAGTGVTGTGATGTGATGTTPPTPAR